MANIILNSEEGKGTIKRVDSRMNGYMNFGYVWIPDHHKRLRFRAKSFQLVRNWCMTTWGPSCELESYEMFLAYTSYSEIFLNQEQGLNPYWAWDYALKRNGTAVFKIFLKTEKELNWFTLRWT